MLTKGLSRNALGSHFRIRKSHSLEGVCMHVGFSRGKNPAFSELLLQRRTSCSLWKGALSALQCQVSLLCSCTSMCGCCWAFFSYFKLNWGLNLTSVFVQSCCYSQCTPAAQKPHWTWSAASHLFFLQPPFLWSKCVWSKTSSMSPTGGALLTSHFSALLLETCRVRSGRRLVTNSFLSPCHTHANSCCDMSVLLPSCSLPSLQVKLDVNLGRNVCASPCSVLADEAGNLETQTASRWFLGNSSVL